MIVVEMGDINHGEVQTGIVIEATRAELSQLRNFLYREVEISEVQPEETEPDDPIH